MTPIVPLAQLEQIAQGIDHAEGVCTTPDGRIYVSGEQGQLYRIADDDTAEQVATTGGWTLGLASDGEGRIYACDPVRHAVLRWTPDAGDPVVWTSGSPDRPMATPNWGAFAPDGSYLVTDSGAWKGRDGCIYVVRDGRTSVWTDESVDFPNGLAVTPDEREVWVLESTPGRLVSFAIRDDGSAGPRRVLTELPGTVPDGIAFATDGTVLIACYRPDVVLRWRPGAGAGDDAGDDIYADAADAAAVPGLEVVAADPEGTVLAAPTNCAFVGPGLDTVVVPNIGRWHVTRFRVPGLRGVPLFRPTRERIGS